MMHSLKLLKGSTSSSKEKKAAKATGKARKRVCRMCYNQLPLQGTSLALRALREMHVRRERWRQEGRGEKYWAFIMQITLAPFTYFTMCSSCGTCFYYRKWLLEVTKAIRSAPK